MPSLADAVADLDIGRDVDRPGRAFGVRGRERDGINAIASNS